jgi:hypothetical protein
MHVMIIKPYAYSTKNPRNKTRINKKERSPPRGPMTISQAGRSEGHNR